MNVLVVGQGGREHAIVKALAQSPRVEKVYALPGNDGMGEAEIIKQEPLNFAEVRRSCRDHNIELVVIGPEDHLAAGLADDLRQHGLRVFGPEKRAAMLEASKIFSKQFMTKYKVPTAPFDVVTSVAETREVYGKYKPPYVLKADGLAAGKGVFICMTERELLESARQIFEEGKLGKAGSQAIIEQYQPGYEISFFVLTNGKDYTCLPLAQDHKRLLEDNQGPNTGGMGTVAPFTIDHQLYEQIINRVVEPTISGFKSENFIYRGVVFIGLMITENGPQVLEYNVRFGDPETQVLMPLLKNEWVQVMGDIADGKLPGLQWQDVYAACVVLAAEGYPDAPKKGVAIGGDFASNPERYFLHAGTRKLDQQWQTNGGRVLNAIGIGKSKSEALANAYKQTAQVEWPGVQFRKDIGSQWK